MIEVWKIIEETPRYSVSNLGNVKNRKTGRVLRPGLNSDGYLNVILARDGLPSLSRKVHRLVAIAFIDNPLNKPEVNHKDENGTKTDNNINNLEWTTRPENMQHAYKNGLNHGSGGLPKKKIQIIETGEIFESQHECARALGGHQSNINAALYGRIKSAYGYTYRFVI